MDARQLAFEILLKIERDKAYSNLELDARLQDAADSRDGSFVTALVYGVLERKITLDYFIKKFYTGNFNKLKSHVLTILRMGVFQIYYMDRVPVSAAVNESVKLAKKNGASFAGGLVNAVLRAASREEPVIPETEDRTAYYSLQYSCPVWLVDLFLRSYGEENTVSILTDALLPPPMTVRVNSLKITDEELMKRFQEQGVTATQLALPHALLLKGAGSPEKLVGYEDGLFHVQDLSSQICCARVDAKEEDLVLDLCSAPGGKSFTLAENMKNRGKLLSYDLYPARVNLVDKFAKKLGINIIKVDQNDASVYNKLIPVADRVLCDVPCSGLGVIRRKPEIRYKSPEEMKDLPLLQYQILDTSSCYVKQEGRLVYSTCTLNPAENEEVVKRFLENHGDFQLIGQETLLPGKDRGDGFFIAVLEKQSHNFDSI